MNEWSSLKNSRKVAGETKVESSFSSVVVFVVSALQSQFLSLFLNCCCWNVTCIWPKLSYSNIWQT